MKTITARINSHGDLFNALAELEHAENEVTGEVGFAREYEASVKIRRSGDDIHLEAQSEEVPRFMWEEVEEVTVYRAICPKCGRQCETTRLVEDGVVEMMIESCPFCALETNDPQQVVYRPAH